MSDERTFSEQTPSPAKSCEELTNPLKDIVGTEDNEVVEKRCSRHNGQPGRPGPTAIGPDSLVLPKILTSASSGDLLVVADVDIDPAVKFRKESLMDRRP